MYLIFNYVQMQCRDRSTFVFVNIFVTVKNVRADMHACASPISMEPVSRNFNEKLYIWNTCYTKIYNLLSSTSRETVDSKSSHKCTKMSKTYKKLTPMFKCS